MRALTRGGALAAFAVGTITYGAGGWAFTLILLAFFVPSVALSRVGRARKQLLVDIGKGGARDAWQVLANGGVATICAAIAGLLLVFITRTGAFAEDGEYFVVFGWHLFGVPHETLLHTVAPARWIAAFAGSYAAATADTWGTEIGTLARGRPHSILTLQPIATGLSGGVTRAGTVAELAGAAWIAAIAALCLTLVDRWPDPHWKLATTAGFIAPIWIGGVLGALVDSLLGATVQELRRCAECGRTCETNPHDCGGPTSLVRGIRGFSNDRVNFGATLTGAAVAFALYR